MSVVSDELPLRPALAPTTHDRHLATGENSTQKKSTRQRSAAQSFVFGEPRLPIPSASGCPETPEVKHLQSGNSSPSGGSQSAHRYVKREEMSSPFKYIGGRRYLRDPTLPYPLPVDLPELHRQSLRLLLLMRLYGAPFCNTTINEEAPPKKVLEIACGTALWSSACHDYFKHHGHDKVSFTGIDIVSLAPDLRQSGVNWRFVQHDVRKRSIPFPDEEFDFIFVKDTAFLASNVEAKGGPFIEMARLLKIGGILEIWESDHMFRALLPEPAVPTGTTEDELEQAEASAAYIISSSTAFAASQNKYLMDYNIWIEQALAKRGLSASPCGLIMWALRMQTDTFHDVGSRRLALPFGNTRWERESRKVELTPNQASLRRTALLTTVQFIESMEPVLKVESGKRQDEWDRWWTNMMNDLLEHDGALNGECLEVGAWWAKKA